MAPWGVYTTGKSLCGIGLIAAIMHNLVMNEMVLGAFVYLAGLDCIAWYKPTERGALVLADNGIGGFDKMDESDQMAIHKVMEQHTISISKAGITMMLNVCTLIQAMANLLYNHYNLKASLVEATNLPAALIILF